MPSGLSFIAIALFVFLLIGILITLLHRYFYQKLAHSFPLNTTVKKMLFIFFGVMAFAPLIIMNPLDIKSGFMTMISYIGYIWIIFLFLFFGLGLAVDAILFFLKLFKRKSTQFTRTIFLMMVGFITIIIISGLYEASDIKIERITIETSKLPAGVDRIRVVQISDVHFSQILGLSHAHAIINIIKELNPDILLSTGDFLDKGIRDEKEITKLFRELKVPLGKYATTGNHEFFAGIKNSEKFITDAGFVLLRNEGVTIKKTLNITAIDDHTGTRFGEILPEEKEVFKNIQRDRFTIHLKHQPRIDKKALELFDLQLSGHTHAGQIFPANLIVKLLFPYNQGTFELGRKKYLHVSRGTGTWGPPIRFFAPPEITVIEMVKRYPK